MITKKITLIISVFCSFMLSQNMKAQCISQTSISNTINTNIQYSLNVYNNNGQDIVVNSGFTLTLYRMSLEMSPNSKIIVKNGAKLVLYGCRIFGCNGMWQGIEVEQGGRVFSQYNTAVNIGGSVIEDAFVGIKFNFSPAGLNSIFNGGAMTESLLIADNIIFNKNEIGIQINGHNDGLVSNGLENFENTFNIFNCVFTCRKIPFLETGGKNYYDGYYSTDIIKETPISLATSYPNNPESYAAPYINNNLYSETDPDAYLKSPFQPNMAKSKIGLDLRFLVNAGSLQNIKFKVGKGQNNNNSTNTNIFDNQDVGIFITSGNVAVHNCAFQNPNPHLNVTNNNFAAGIYLIGEPATSFNVAIETQNGTPRNAFYNTQTAIKGENVDELIADDCFIISDHNINTPSQPYFKGLYGIDVNTYKWDNISIINNKIYNIAYGIYVADNSYYSNNDNSILNVSNNTINAINTAIATSTVNNYTDRAIIMYSIADYIGTYNEKAVICNSNVIDNVFDGILFMSFMGVNSDVSNNNINLKIDPLYPNQEHYGIKLMNNEPVSYDPLIDPNSGLPNTSFWGNTCIGNTIIGNGDDKLQNGIYAAAQYGTNFGCNNVSQLNHGIRFFDVNYSTQFWDNWMDKTCQYGFTLSQGLIGQQGTLPRKGVGGCPSNNHWPGTNSDWLTTYSIPHYKTFNDNSFNINSAFVVKNTSPEFNPNGCGYIDNSNNGGNIFSYQHTGAANAPLSNTNTLLYISNLLPNCDRCDASASRMAVPEMQEEEMEMLEQIADESIELPTDDADKRLYSLQQQVYEMLKQKPELAQNSTELQSFLQNNSLSAFDFIHYTGKYIAQNNTAFADLLLGFWPQTYKDLDNNYRVYYSWMNNLKQDPANKPNLTDVLALANQCPQKGGKVVYAARTLYNSLTHKVHYFENNCNDIVFTKTKQKNIEPIKVETVSVFPNPNTGSFNVLIPKSSALVSTNWIFELSDVYGKSYLHQKLLSNTSTICFNKKGIYFGTLTNTLSNRKITTKIIFQ